MTILDLSQNLILSKHDLKRIDEQISSIKMLETLILPSLQACHISLLLKYLYELTKKNTLLKNICSDLDKVKLTHRDARYYAAIQSRLKRNNEKLFAIHGGGNIGLGLMADMIRKSVVPYKITATTRDMFVAHIINSTNCFYLQHSSKNWHKQTAITNVHMVDARIKKHIIALYVDANYLALCLTESGLIKQARWIAQGLIARYRKDKSYLKIFVVMNKSDCHTYVANLVKKHLSLLLTDELKIEKIMQLVEFIPTMVDRVVSKVDRRCVLTNLRSELKLPKRKVFSAFSKLDKFSQHTHLKLGLFRAEKNAKLYIPDTVRESFLLPTATRVKNVKRWIEIKNKYINRPHAILAWSGGLLGYKTIGEAINDPEIAHFIKKLMKEEITPILRAEYPDLSREELRLIERTFIQRCKQSAHDKIERVGRDPLRKLNSGGCIRGVLELSKKNHLGLSTPRIVQGIAAGVLYAVKEIDKNNEECRLIQHVYKQNRSFKAVLCHPYAKTFKAWDPIQDESMVNKILRQILSLEVNLAYNKKHLAFH